MKKSNIPRELEKLFSKEIQESLIRLRRNLHQNPELSFKEEKTAQKLFDELKKIHPIELHRVAETGVIARIKGRNSQAPVVAVRGDIDALPIQEATGLEFASQNDGVMHACGHDVHATWTVGAAYLLAKRPADGDVLIILQPAEEIAKGALAIMESGHLDEVQAIFGAHVDRRFEVGQVVAQEGPLAASTDTFEIEYCGRGAHGARPQESADPIVGMAALITSLQTIVSRRLDPASAGVVTVGTINAGNASNIIPEKAHLSGTIRSVDEDTRKLLQDQIRKIAESTATAYELKSEVKIEYGTPPIVNPSQPTQWASEAVTSLLGKDALVPLNMLNMGGEDFACYMEKMAGCFIRIGAREAGGKIIPAHSPQFYAAEECIFVGAAILAEIARIASQAIASPTK